jgi:hypothetical protein
MMHNKGEPECDALRGEKRYIGTARKRCIWKEDDALSDALLRRAETVHVMHNVCKKEGGEKRYIGTARRRWPQCIWKEDYTLSVKKRW